ncbi:MAG: septum formation initiator family protein [Chloroflexota bacterium]|nr:septum formation initiator family protein [Chloroflexota bacterium]MDE2896140.1 septum formation initiator family protein [Chloroflexota bacterium]
MADMPVERTVEIVTDTAIIPAPEGQRQSRRPSQTAVLPWVLRRVAFVGSLLLVGFVVFSGVEGLLQANSLDDRIIETRAEIEQLRRDTQQLAALVAWLDSDAYIERIAREDLGMVRPGEESFAVHSPGRGDLEITRSPWWANLLPDEVQDLE